MLVSCFACFGIRGRSYSNFPASTVDFVVSSEVLESVVVITMNLQVISLETRSMYTVPEAMALRSVLFTQVCAISRNFHSSRPARLLQRPEVQG